VLFILPDTGSPPTKGYQVRCLEIARRLSSRYVVRIVAARQSATVESLDADARPLWRGASLLQRLIDGSPLQSALFDGSDVARRAVKLAGTWRPDAVVVVTERLPEITFALRGNRLVLDVVDSMRLHMNERAARGTFPWSAIWSREGTAFGRLAPRLRAAVSAIVVASDTALSDYPEAVVIPNAARPSSLARLAPTIDVVFTGTLSYWPNARAALAVCREITPLIRAGLPDVRIVIAGRKPGTELREACVAAGVGLLSDVSDMDEILRRSRLALAPIEWTPGANLKILEALAAGTPVLAYRAAAAQLPAGTVGVRICEDAAAMAIATIEVLKGDYVLPMGDRDQHTWTERAAALERVLDRVIATQP
jgi:glycosyltransferase involved in cell wall biosynthesis